MGSPGMLLLVSANTPCSQRRGQSLVRKLDPMPQLRVPVPQVRPCAVKSINIGGKKRWGRFSEHFEARPQTRTEPNTRLQLMWLSSLGRCLAILTSPHTSRVTLIKVWNFFFSTWFPHLKIVWGGRGGGERGGRRRTHMNTS